MAELDVTELMTDPDFVSAFTVIRAGQVIDQHGRAQLTPGPPTRIIGVVFPITPRTMNQMSDFVNANGAIEIYTKFRLEGPSLTTRADTIIWQDNIYVVANVSSYAHFGRGFVRVVCELRDLLAPSPALSITDQGA